MLREFLFERPEFHSIRLLVCTGKWAEENVEISENSGGKTWRKLNAEHLWYLVSTGQPIPTI